MDEIEIVVDVPESIMAADLSSADIVEMMADRLAGAGNCSSRCRFAEIAQVADPVTQTFHVRAAMRAPEGVNLLAGHDGHGDGDLSPLRHTGQRMLVPIAATVKEPSGEQVVWVVGAGSSRAATARENRRGGSGGQVEIVGGSFAGRSDCRGGATFLREGMKVRDLGDALGGGQS